MNSATLTRSYYHALDGLRGIAILLVICSHNFNFFPWFEFGWVGVDLFFVLSGFLITDILLKAKGSKNFLVNFYIRRILRIVPLYYGALLLFFLIAPAFVNLKAQYDYYHSNQLMSWLHMQNWLYVFNEVPNNFLLLNHFWSLSVEEQFYLIWPFLILAVKNHRSLCRIIYILLGICILSRYLSWLYFGDGYTNYQFQYMTRADGLCIGSLVAIWRFNGYEYARKKVIQCGTAIFSIHFILLILVKTIFTGIPYFRFIGYTSIAAIFGIVIFFVSEKRNAYSKLLFENALLKYTGKISYGLYVYHWPFLALSKIYVLDMLINDGFGYDKAYIIVSLLAFALTVLVSIASYHFLEKRILLLKEVITRDGFFIQMKRKLMLLIKPATAR